MFCIKGMFSRGIFSRFENIGLRYIAAQQQEIWWTRPDSLLMLIIGDLALLQSRSVGTVSWAGSMKRSWLSKARGGSITPKGRCVPVREGDL